MRELFEEVDLHNVVKEAHLRMHNIALLLHSYHFVFFCLLFLYKFVKLLSVLSLNGLFVLMCT